MKRRRESPRDGSEQRGRPGLEFIVPMPSCADLRELMALPCKEWMCLELPNKSVKRASPRAQNFFFFFPHVSSEPCILHCLLDVKEQNAFQRFWLKFGKRVVKMKQLQTHHACTTQCFAPSFHKGFEWKGAF